MRAYDSTAMQNLVWHLYPHSSREAQTIAPALLLLPALNEIIDITTTRTAAAKTHPSAIICAMVAVLALGLLLPPGHSAGQKKPHSWTHPAGFVLIMALSVYRIVDRNLLDRASSALTRPIWFWSMRNVMH